jgi:uncharacterized protein
VTLFRILTGNTVKVNVFGLAGVRHKQHGADIAGTILFLPGTKGSHSASAVLLELIHRGVAPAAIIMNEPDAVLLLG